MRDAAGGGVAEEIATVLGGELGRERVRRHVIEFLPWAVRWLAAGGGRRGAPPAPPVGHRVLTSTVTGTPLVMTS
jgi:hypothetical protein